MTYIKASAFGAAGVILLIVLCVKRRHANRILERASTMERDGIADAIEEDVDEHASKPGRCKRFFVWVANFFAVKLRILLPLFQILTKLGPSFRIPFPKIYVGALDWVQAVNLGIPDLMPLSCMGYAMNYYKSFMLRLSP